MKKFLIFILPIFLAMPVQAASESLIIETGEPTVIDPGTTTVTGDGKVIITGEVSNITRDTFKITQDGRISEVMFDRMNDDNIKKMREANILQNGAFVTVEGKLDEGPFNRTVIKADNIYVQSADNPLK